MGLEGKRAVRVPVSGRIVEASIDYADLRVQSGQTIRLVAEESGGNPKDRDGRFPTVFLTLN
jgi:hypothetical protein